MNALEVKELSVTDRYSKELLLDNVSFSLERHSCLGIVGESGSGKSLTVKAMLSLLHPSLQIEGRCLFDSHDILAMNEQGLRQVRGRQICMIPQDAMTAFDPLYTIGSQLLEAYQEHIPCSKAAAEELVLNALQAMCINEPDYVIQQYPHQLSGGMLQRCLIAGALSVDPAIIIADEPTTALDAINQMEVVQEFLRLKQMVHASLIVISHDLGVIDALAERVLVMKEGRIVESGATADVFRDPQHVYTQYLLETQREMAQGLSELGL